MQSEMTSQTDTSMQSKMASQAGTKLQSEILSQIQEELSLYEAMQRGERYLQNCGIEDAAVDAWLLLEYVTEISRTKFLLERKNRMPKPQQQAYFDLIEKRGTHIPLQHLTGVQEFMGFSFLVNEHVLIPRQDTELLVEEALKRLKPGMRLLDLCTGSGCIAVSLALLAEERIKRFPTERKAQQSQQDRSIYVDASDISADALCVAEKNVAALGVPVQLIRSDLFEKITEKYDIIVSNPPYIRTAVIEELAEEVKSHDPFLALDGKEDGLYFYRRIVEKSPEYLKNGGYLLFEIGHDQGQEVSALMRTRGFEQVQVYRDLAGLDRVVVGMWTLENDC